MLHSVTIDAPVDKHARQLLMSGQAVIALANEAIIQSAQQESSSNKRYNFPVKGCMLFGVPNKGSEVADSASKILKLLATVFNVNRNMVADLQSKSHKLADIAAQFRQIRSEHGIPVVSFYEKQNFNSVLGLVSPEAPLPCVLESCAVRQNVTKHHHLYCKIIPQSLPSPLVLYFLTTPYVAC